MDHIPHRSKDLHACMYACMHTSVFFLISYMYLTIFEDQFRQIIYIGQGAALWCSPKLNDLR